jgi:hypothetical protein
LRFEDSFQSFGFLLVPHVDLLRSDLSYLQPSVIIIPGLNRRTFSTRTNLNHPSNLPQSQLLSHFNRKPSDQLEILFAISPFLPPLSPPLSVAKTAEDGKNLLVR